MSEIDFIKEIETSFNVGSLKVKDMEIWPFLRKSYYFTYRNKYIFNINNEKGTDIIKIINTFMNVFYGIQNLFKKYDYIIFSNIGERRVMNNKYVNKLVHNLISELGEDKVLLVEHPSMRSHYRLNLLSDKNIISANLFHIFSYLPLFKNNTRIDNENILKEINKIYKIKVNYRYIISRFIIYLYLLNFFYRIYKPKKIFVTQYYSLFHQAAIYTFNNKGLNSIEFQHGVINNQHPAYNLFTKLDNAFFPKYLLVFGDSVKKIFNTKNYFIDPHNVFSVGNMYLDYIKNEYIMPNRISKKFKNFRRHYNKIIAVSSQKTIESRLLLFIKKLSSLNENILYIFIPREINKDFSNEDLPSNIIILKELNVYQIIKESDYHSTVYSTCALEAPALGIPNILINIDGLAKKYYGKILTNKETTRFIDLEKEYHKTILNWKIKTKKEIMNLHNNFYEKDHITSLKQALKNM